MGQQPKNNTGVEYPSLLVIKITPRGFLYDSSRLIVPERMEEEYVLAQQNWLNTFLKYDPN